MVDAGEADSRCHRLTRSGYRFCDAPTCRVGDRHTYARRLTPYPQHIPRFASTADTSLRFATGSVWTIFLPYRTTNGLARSMALFVAAAAPTDLAGLAILPRRTLPTGRHWFLPFIRGADGSPLPPHSFSSNNYAAVVACLRFHHLCGSATRSLPFTFIRQPYSFLLTWFLRCGNAVTPTTGRAGGCSLPRTPST